MEDPTTIPRLLRLRAGDSPGVAAQLSKDAKHRFIPVSYAELYDEVRLFAAGLLSMGVKRGDAVGLISDNRKEWLVADLATLCLGAADVPRGRDSMPHEVAYILSTPGCRVCFAENVEQLEKILSVKAELPELQNLIVLDDGYVPSSGDMPAIPMGVDVRNYRDVVADGKNATEKDTGRIEKEIEVGDGGDTATIIFTSGTTGEPKGVMLSHANMIHILKGIPRVAHVEPGDIWLSVLPVWHSFERIVQYVALYTTSTLAYSKPIGKIMLRDFNDVRPMWMAAVPRIWEAVRAGVYRTVNEKGGVSKALFLFFVAVGTAWFNLKTMVVGRMPRFRKRSRFLDFIVALVPLVVLTPFKILGDRLVFASIKKKLGGRFVLGISGGGGLPDKVAAFYNAASITVVNGYGLTETAPVIAFQPQFKNVPYTMSPFPDTEIRIVDESGNDAPPGRKGVIKIRGPQVMKGYYEREDLTKGMIDSGGWLDTGDIGIWTHDGEFAIRGRAKDTIVLFGGENVEPVPIEEVLRQSPYVDQVVVVGQDQKYLGALILPDYKEVELNLKSSGVPYVARETLAEMPETIELIQEEVSSRINARAGFKSFERINRFSLLEEAFTVGVELSGKQEVKRHVIAEMYEKKIASLFR